MRDNADEHRRTSADTYEPPAQVRTTPPKGAPSHELLREKRSRVQILRQP